MKSKFFVVVVALLLVAALFPTPAAAFSGVYGNVIDSKVSQPWAYGGQIYIVSNTQGIVGTGWLDANGHFDIPYGVDDTGVCGGTCNTPNDGDTITIYIDFTCALSCNGLGPAPYEAPGTNSDVSFLEVAALPFAFNSGYIRTGTGPTAIELKDFTVTTQSSSNTWLPFVLLVGSVALVGGAVTAIRRRRA